MSLELKRIQIRLERISGVVFAPYEGPQKHLFLAGHIRSTAEQPSGAQETVMSTKGDKL